MTETAIMKQWENLSLVKIGDDGRLVIRDLQQATILAAQAQKANMLPKSWRTPQAAAIALICGSELRLPLPAILSGIAIIDQKPSVYGEIARMLTLNHPLCRQIDEWWQIGDERITDAKVHTMRVEDMPDDLMAICEIRRTGHAKAFCGYFSINEAKHAGLWARQSSSGGKMPWSLYEPIMLQYRAFHRAEKKSGLGAFGGMGIVEAMPREVQSRVVESSVVSHAPTQGRNPIIDDIFGGDPATLSREPPGSPDAPDTEPTPDQQEEPPPSGMPDAEERSEVEPQPSPPFSDDEPVAPEGEDIPY